MLDASWMHVFLVGIAAFGGDVFGISHRRGGHDCI